MANTVAGYAGDGFSIALILSPVDTMVRIKRDNSVGERSVYNYAGTFANAVCWVGYAAPTHGWFIAGVNIAAIILEFFYTCFYHWYAEGKQKTIAMIAIVAELLWGFLMLIVYFAAFFGGRNEEVRKSFFGSLAGATAIVMYASMIPDNNAAQQSILLLLSSVGNCASWTAFGIKPRDLIVLVPNAVGLVLTVCQSVVWVAVKIIFRNAAPQQPPANNNQMNQAGGAQANLNQVPVAQESNNQVAMHVELAEILP